MKEFTFRCKDCNHRFDGPYLGEKPPTCFRCGGLTVRVYLPPAIAFKGGGFTRSTGA